ADVGRIDNKFLFTIPVPQQSRAVRTPAMDFIGRQPLSNQYRVIPMNGEDPMHYVSQNIPVLFTSNAVQQRRWQEFLDVFNMASSMPDLLNVRYLVEAKDQYEKDKAALAGKFTPVFEAPGDGTVVLENKSVLPKAWLVPSVALVNSTQDTLGVLQNPNFNPRQLALVESAPPIQLAPPN